MYYEALHIDYMSTQSESALSSDAQSSKETEKPMTAHCNFVSCKDQANYFTQNNVALTNSCKSSSHSLIISYRSSIRSRYLRKATSM